MKQTPPVDKPPNVNRLRVFAQIAWIGCLLQFVLIIATTRSVAIWQNRALTHMLMAANGGIAYEFPAALIGPRTDGRPREPWFRGLAYAAGSSSGWWSFVADYSYTSGGYISGPFVWLPGIDGSYRSGWTIAVLPLWIPLAISTCFAIRLTRRYRRSILRYCRGCSYDLTGNTSGVCPECGSPIRTGIE